MPSTCEATPPHSCTNLQLIWANVALSCSDNQRGWNGGQLDVQDQGERTQAYLQLGSASHHRKHMLFRTYKLLRTCGDRNVHQLPITLLARGFDD